MRARNRLSQLILALLIALIPGCGMAYDFIQGQGDAMSGNLLLSSPSPTMLLSLPGTPLAKVGWVVETGYARPFGLSELDQYFVAGVYRRGQISASGGISSLGKSDLYSELTGKLSFAYCFDSLAAGGSMTGRLLQFGYGYENLSAVSFGLGLSYRREAFLLAATVDNLNSPRFMANSVSTRPLYSVFGEYRGKKSYSVFGRFSASKDYETQIAFGQRIRLGVNGAFLWSMQTKPLRYGCGIELELLRSLLAYSFSIHPTLGYSHTISIVTGSLITKPAVVDDEFE